LLDTKTIFVKFHIFYAWTLFIYKKLYNCAWFNKQEKVNKKFIDKLEIYFFKYPYVVDHEEINKLHNKGTFL